MTVIDEAKQIRSEVAKRKPGRGRKYKRAFRQQVVLWYRRALESGMSHAECQQTTGLSLKLIEKWCDAEALIAATIVPLPHVPKAGPTTSMVPVVLQNDLPFGPGFTFAMPSGHRIEGLSLDQAIGLLRAFA